MKTFKLVAISENTNSFGLKSLILVAKDGEAWQVLKSPYGGQALPALFSEIELESPLRSSLAFNFEVPRRLENCPPKARKEFWERVPA